MGGGKSKLKGKNNILELDKPFKCKKRYFKIIGNNNIVKVSPKARIHNIKISISGDNNKLTIGSNFKCDGLFKVTIAGSNNNILLGDDIKIVSQLVIYNHDNSQNCSIIIGNNTSFYKTEISAYDNDSSITIGEDCMFGYDTIVYNTDGHAIYQNGKIINQAKNLTIGNHVWLGWASTILKNSFIQDGCIVAKSAVVSGKFEKNNCILAGIPAKIVKENISWDRQSVNSILND